MLLSYGGMALKAAEAAYPSRSTRYSISTTKHLTVKTPSGVFLINPMNNMNTPSSQRQ
jgi:hypothetical protein